MVDQAVNIIRVQHNTDNPYFMMVRKTAQHRDLSWEARGVLAYLLSQPDNWQVQPEDLQQGCGRDKVIHILNELKVAGHLIIAQGRAEKGKFAKGDYIVFESPTTEKAYAADAAQPITEKAYADTTGDISQTDYGLPVTGKPHLHNSNNRIEKKEKKDNGAGAPISLSSIKGKKAPATKPGRKTKKTPPPPPPQAAKTKRKTDLEKWLDRAAAQLPMVEALLVQFQAGYDPAFQKVAEYATIAILAEYVPIAEDLTRVGCKPEQVQEIYKWLKPSYAKNQWKLAPNSISKRYQDWKAQAQQVKPRPAPVSRPAKSVPVVQSAEERQRAAETLAMLLAARQSRPA